MLNKNLLENFGQQKYLREEEKVKCKKEMKKKLQLKL